MNATQEKANELVRWAMTGKKDTQRQHEFDAFIKEHPNEYKKAVNSQTQWGDV